MDLRKDIENKIAIAEKCIEIIKQSEDFPNDDLIWQMQFHKGYIMAMNEVLPEVKDVLETIEANGRSLIF